MRTRRTAVVLQRLRKKLKDFGTLLKDPAFPERTYIVGLMWVERGAQGVAPKWSQGAAQPDS
jgi:hypothetical protein